MIAQEKELCEQHMGRYPVISLSLKQVYGLDFKEAERMMRSLISMGKSECADLFSSSMKTNPYMEFAIVTGCLRISKESIFTGFNNPKIHTIADERYDEWFGFTDAELRKLVKALEAGDAKELEAVLNESLAGSVSYLDGGRIKEKEAFYHGLLLGMLKSRKGWIVRSNREVGEGRLDLVMHRERENSAIIFEVKYTKDYKDLEGMAMTALDQIKGCRVLKEIA